MARPDAESPAHFILVRGLARESRHWGGFPAVLASELEAKVDAIDLPGTGKFSEMRSPTSIREIAEFVREKFLELRRRQRASGEKPAPETYLVAMSLGGMVASYWLERWPDDFTGCVLINTSFRGVSPFHHRLRPRAFGHLARILHSRNDALASERHVLKLISNNDSLHDQTAGEWAKIRDERPVSLENFARQLIAAASFRSSLAKPPIPVLFLTSENDRMVHPSCSETIARDWCADLRRHKTAGHDIPLDDKAWVISEIGQWRERLTYLRGPKPATK